MTSDIKQVGRSRYGIQRMCLNPAYLLRQDGTRAIIVSENEDQYGLKQWFSFIHPLHAKILSLIRGRDLLDEEVNTCAGYLGIHPKVIWDFILPLIDNQDWKTCVVGENRVHFPPKLIVDRVNTSERRICYTPEEFKCYESIDLITERLYYPIHIMMELTMQCYVNCEYCYADRRQRRYDNLATSEIINLIRQFHRDGALQIDINGGEVLLHHGIKDILCELDDLNYSPLVSTKMPIDEDMVVFLKQLKNIRLQMSLDAADQKVLTRLINAPVDYLSSISETLRILDKYGMSVQINGVLTKLNCKQDDIISLVEFLQQYDCVTSLKLNLCGYSLYKNSYESLRLSVKDIERIENVVDGLKRTSRFPINMAGYDKMSDYIDHKSEEKFCKRPLCSGNVRNAVVLPNGQVTICEELYYHPAFIIGDLKQSSLNEIWNGDRALSLFEKAMVLNSASVCKTCDSWDACRKGAGVCWKTILMAYGQDNWNYPDPRCPKSPPPCNIFCIDDRS